jgi:ribosome-associated protein
LETLLSALKERKKSPIRLTRNSKLLKTILAAIGDKKGEAIVSLDLRNIEEAVADFFIVCQARSNTQRQAIVAYVVDEMKEQCNERPYQVTNGDEWALIDYAQVVVHVFDPECRRFYDLENLWADAVYRAHNDL